MSTCLYTLPLELWMIIERRALYWLKMENGKRIKFISTNTKEKKKKRP